jgi:Uma2 family endonuclease
MRSPIAFYQLVIHYHYLLIKAHNPPDKYTISTLDKRPIYAAIGVPELWRYDGNKLEVFVLHPSNRDYQQVNQNPTFPWMPLDVIPRFIRQSLVDGETATLRAFRAWVREQQNG